MGRTPHWAREDAKLQNNHTVQLNAIKKLELHCKTQIYALTKLYEK